MPRLILITWIFFVGFNSSLEATPVQSDSTSKYAFQFLLKLKLPQYLDVASFEGALISGRYRFNEKWAIRLGLSGDALHRKYDYFSETIYSTTDSLNKVVKKDEVMTYLGLKVTLDFLRYWPVAKRFAGYGGLGFQSGVNRRKFDYGGEQNYKSIFLWGEVYSILGAEWSLSDNVQLGIEYRFFLSKLKITREDLSISYNSTLWQGKGNLIYIILSIGL